MQTSHLSAKFAILNPEYVTYVIRVDLIRKVWEGGIWIITGCERTSDARLEQYRLNPGLC
jgi:hypothetical protein